MKRIFYFTAFLLFTVSVAEAQVPQTISYQGFYTDTNGVPVNDGPNDKHKVEFLFFEGDAANSSFTQTIENVKISKGLFSVIIGRNITLEDGPSNPPLPFDIWLKAYKVQVKIDGTLIGDKISFTTVPYAFTAARVDGANITTGTVADARLEPTLDLVGFNASGNITAGGNLTVTGTMTGNGSGISALHASNVATGTIADARLESTVDINAVNVGSTGQFAVNTTGNITKIKNLTYDFPADHSTGTTFLSNNGTGILTWSSALNGNGSGITSINASNVASGTLADSRLETDVDVSGYLTTGGGLHVGGTADPGADNLVVDGIITGNGSGITAVNASNILSGTIADARLETTVDVNAVNVGTTGQFAVNSTGNISKIKNLSYDFPAAHNTGTTFLSNDGNGTLTWSNVLSGNGSALTSLAAGNLSGSVAVANGGTGAATIADARTNLGLAIGTNVQGYDADLDDLADGTLSGSKIGSGVSAANLSGSVAVANGGTGAATTADARTNLGLAIGTNVQGYDADLDDLADGTLSGSKIGAGISAANLSGSVAVANGGTGAATAADARTNLGLAIGTNVQAYDADLDDLADGTLSGSKIGSGISTANLSGSVAVANGGTGAATAADARTNLGLAIGTNVQAYDADLDDLSDGTLSDSKLESTVDLTALTVGSSQFSVNNSGNITKIKNLTYDFPASHNTGTTFLSNNGSGTLSWSNTLSGSGASITSLNGSNISSGTVADARLESTIDQTIFNASDYMTAIGGVYIGAASDPGDANLAVTGKVRMDATPNFTDAYILEVESTSTGAVMKVHKNQASGTSLLDFYRSSTLVGNISESAGTISYNPFTGSHFGRSDETLEVGTLVSMTGQITRMNALADGEPIYEVLPTSIPNDSRVMGAFLHEVDTWKENPTPGVKAIMAVGNGSMWVADKGGNVKVGDYLISSDIKGHAMKDNGSYKISYVIARAAEDVEWTNVSSTINGIKHKKISVFFENFTVNHEAHQLLAEVDQLKQEIRELKLANEKINQGFSAEIEKIKILLSNKPQN